MDAIPLGQITHYPIREIMAVKIGDRYLERDRAGFSDGRIAKQAHLRLDVASLQAIRPISPESGSECKDARPARAVREEATPSSEPQTS